MPEAADLYRHRGTRAIQRMVEFAPSTGGLALWVRHVDLPQDARAPAIATDGHTLYYGSDFGRLALAEQTGLVAHEVLHVALRHPQRLVELRRLLGEVDLPLFNICADAIVNSTLGHLTWLTLPPSAVFLGRLLAVALSERISEDQALLQWDVEKLYRAIDDRRITREARPEDGPRAAQARLLGGDTPADLMAREQHGAPETQAEEARTWSERLLRAHAGDGAHSMLRTLIADVPRTRTPWEQVLRTRLAQGLAPKPGISWSRPSRSYIANQGRSGRHRLPWTPGSTARRPSPHLVVIVDVSASIGAALLEKFSREIEAIARRQAAALVLIVGDDQVRRVQTFAPGRADFRGVDVAGGGGTDFTPLLEEAGKHSPDVVVVLTDLDGPARFRPAWPVIWAVPEACASAVQPFGRKLLLS